MPAKEQIRISVRGLVEFLYRSGNIDDSHSGARDQKAMEAGSRLHRKLQKQMGSSYMDEVSLKWTSERELYTITVEGRADGIFPDDNGKMVIDEIKGIYKDVEKLEAPIEVHKAQAMCYAYIYCTENALPGMGVQMTYANLDTELVKRFREDYSAEELVTWFENLIGEYDKWARLLATMRTSMRESLEEMEFPFAYRPGQRKLAVSVYQTIRQEKELFIQAPTGIGKTMSVLFPSVKAMGQGLADKFFYLTAKTITRTVAEEALDILRAQGMKLRSVTLTAKEKICPMTETKCNPLYCPYAEGHFNRVNEALYDILIHESSMNRENIQVYAEKHRVCPFEYSLDLTLWTQGVICDYNYVYDPKVYLRRFFGDTVSERYIFLVDEAHNLPERARNMYSAVLIKENVLAAEKILKDVVSGTDSPDAVKAAGKAARTLRALNKKLLALKKEYDKPAVIDSVESLALTTGRLQDEISSYLEETVHNVDEIFLEFYFELRHFNAMYEMMDDHYIPFVCMPDGHFVVKLFCANPAKAVENCADRAIASIYFSATMLPMRYYKNLLTEKEDSYAIYVDTPFDPSKRLLLTARDMSSRYSERSQAQYEKVWEYIRKVTGAKKGNYMVFFPSYQYMECVMGVYEDWIVRMEEQGDGHGKKWDNPYQVLMQESGMSEEKRDEFLWAFSTPDRVSGDSSRSTRSSADEVGKENEEALECIKTLIGFCVLGGIFSEGIDLTGEKLIGTIIVGTGLGQMDTEGGFLKDYFNEQGYDGFDYAYRFPGINRVFQAAGRVIRTAEDTGVVVLLDNRMLREDHVKLFPMDWANYQETSVKEIDGQLEHFWK